MTVVIVILCAFLGWILFNKYYEKDTNQKNITKQTENEIQQNDEDDYTNFVKTAKTQRQDSIIIQNQQIGGR